MRCTRSNGPRRRLRAADARGLPTSAGGSRFSPANWSAAPANGSAVGRILIPRIGASYVIVNGTGTEELKGGPGIYPETSFPGVAGTTAIAGHRTTYLAPFRHIDSLRPGNRILLYMPYAHFTYTVIGQRSSHPRTSARRSTRSAIETRAVGVHAAVQRGQTPAGVRPPDTHRARGAPRGGSRAVECRDRSKRLNGAPKRGGPRPRRSSPAVLESLESHVLFPLADQRHAGRPLDHAADPGDLHARPPR